MRTRKSVLLAVVLVATMIGALQLAGLSRAASHVPAASNECRLLSCIFDDADDVD
jgi:hypothetical protein